METLNKYYKTIKGYRKSLRTENETIIWLYSYFSGLFGFLPKKIWAYFFLKEVPFERSDTIFAIKSDGTIDDYIVHYIGIIDCFYYDEFPYQQYDMGGYALFVQSPYGRYLYDKDLKVFSFPEIPPLKYNSLEELLNFKINQPEMDFFDEYQERTVLFGRNVIDFEVPSISEIIYRNIFNMLLLHKIFLLTLWILIKYYKYAFVIFSLYLYNLINRINSELKFRSKIKSYNKKSSLITLNYHGFIPSPKEHAMPNDIIIIEPGDDFPCDCEIIAGNVVLDESFLSGESNKVFKSTGHIIYAGTKIINSSFKMDQLENISFEKFFNIKTDCTEKESAKQSVNYKADLKNHAIGMVKMTGKRTKKNQLFNQTMKPRKFINKYEIEANKIIKFMAIFAGIMFAVFSCILIGRVGIMSNLEFSLDLFFAFFSPEIYSILELGANKAKNNLLIKNIYTNSCTSVENAGMVDLVIFDKTGTLTNSSSELLFIDTIEKIYFKFKECPFIYQIALSSCHYVVQIDSQFSGDDLDLQTFRFTKSTITEHEFKRFIKLSSKVEIQDSRSNTEESEFIFSRPLNSNLSNSSEDFEDSLIEIIKIYDFDFFLKRMSVIAKIQNKKYLFCKGAPNAIAEILVSLPFKYEEKVKEYSFKGYRLLALAYKEIDFISSRKSDESSLKFLGLIAFSNKIKKEAISVVSELMESNIGCKMCTGDNILTAISVAKDCGMIDYCAPVLIPQINEYNNALNTIEWVISPVNEYFFDENSMKVFSKQDNSKPCYFVMAIEGKEYDILIKSQFENFVLENCAVYARFDPSHKTNLMEKLNNRAFPMFCGDGVNDTGALFASPVGLSLGCSEACLAAPFNSNTLESTVELIKEGRSALASCVIQFKYTVYSQILSGIQMAVLLPKLFFPSDSMSLINDLMSIYVLGYLLASFRCATKINKKKPKFNLIKDSVELGLELILISLILALFTIISRESTISSNISAKSIPSTIIYPGIYCLLILKAIIFSQSDDHRESLYRNKTMLIILSIFTIFGCFIHFSIYSKSSIMGRFFEFEYSNNTFFFALSNTITLLIVSNLLYFGAKLYLRKANENLDASI